MEEKQIALSDEIIIEIVHSIKDILVALIDRAFPRGQRMVDEYEEVYK